MPSYPKNYPFYSWMPKPLGIIILLFFFLPILTVGGVYSVNSTEMMSGLGIISEHIRLQMGYSGGFRPGSRSVRVAGRTDKLYHRDWI